MTDCVIYQDTECNPQKLNCCGKFVCKESLSQWFQQKEPMICIWCRKIYENKHYQYAKMIYEFSFVVLIAILCEKFIISSHEFNDWFAMIVIGCLYPLYEKRYQRVGENILSFSLLYFIPEYVNIIIYFNIIICFSSFAYKRIHKRHDLDVFEK